MAINPAVSQYVADADEIAFCILFEGIWQGEGKQDAALWVSVVSLEHQASWHSLNPNLSPAWAVQECHCLSGLLSKLFTACKNHTNKGA